MDVAAMLTEFDDHGFNAVSTTRRMSILNDTYYDICSREPWPFLETRVRFTFTGQAYEPITPATDIRAVTAMKRENGGNKLMHLRNDVYEEAYGDNTILVGGSPSIFTIDGQNAVHFYPAPSATDVVRCTYIRRPPALTSTTLEASILLPYEFHRSALVNGALFKMYAMEDDTDIAPTFESYYERAIQNMREQLWKNDYTTPDIIHPSDPTDIGIEMGIFGTWVP